MMFPIQTPRIKGRLFLSSFILGFVGLMLPSGCSVKSDMMTHLSDTIVNNDDLPLVEAGAPAYLLMIDSLISEDPDSKEMLSTAAQLYTAYADVFVTDEQRSRKMAAKALTYANQAMCISNDPFNRKFLY